jgi:type VI secretion system protein ImpF
VPGLPDGRQRVESQERLGCELIAGSGQRREFGTVEQRLALRDHAVAGVQPASFRLRPSLLDRLTVDDSLGSRSETLSVNQLRQNILRDLEWLLETKNLGQIEDLTAFPNVQRSVINYGWLDMTGFGGGPHSAEQIKAALTQAIRNYEPRIALKSVDLQIVERSRRGHSALVLTIVGDLFAEPAPLHVVLRSEIDSETGTVKVSQSNQ